MGGRGGPLLERDDELSTLEDLVEAAASGSGALAVVEGPAGIGKSVLVEEFATRCAARSLRLLRARGAELESGFAFGVVRQLFEAPLSGAAASQRQGWLAGAAGLTLPLWGGAGDATVGPDTAFALAHGLYWLLANMADEQPVVVVIDDCHQADEPSLQWLSYLVRRLEGVPVLVVIAVRTGEAATQAETLQAVVHEPNTVVRQLAPLSAGAAADLVRVRLGAQAADAFCEACYAATGGNPFFLHELLNALADEDVAPEAGAASLVAAQSPAAIRRSLLVRLSRLGDAPRALARAVAVLGPDAELRHAARLAGVDLETAATAADMLAEVELLAPGRPLAFVHPIVATAVETDLAAGERARLHGQAADVLATEATPAERVAAHLLLTEPAGRGEVVDTLRAAAAEAVARGSPASALSYLRRALAEPPSPDCRAALLAELGQSAFLVGDPSALSRLQQAYVEASEPMARAAIAGQLAVVLVIADQLEDAVAILERTIDELGDAHSETIMTLEAQLLGVAVLVASARSRQAERVERLRGRDFGDSPASRILLAALASWTLSENQPRSAVRDLSLRALADGKLLEEQGPASQIFYMASNPLHFCGEYERSAHWLDQAVQSATRLGTITGVSVASCWLGLCSWLRGDLAAAEAQVRAAFAPAGDELPIGGFAIGGIWPLIEVMIEQGRLDEAEDLLDTVPQGLEANDSMVAKVILRQKGRLSLALGDPRSALDYLFTLGGWTDQLGASLATILPWRPTAAAALLALGGRDRAIELAEEQLTLTRDADNPREIGVALRTLGLASGGSEGLSHLEESVEVLEGSDALLEHAHSLVELGATLRRAKQRVAARAFLEKGLALASSCQATVLARRAEDELRLAGAHRGSSASEGIASLTPAEWRVAQMARRGVRNRDIAQALFVSLKTVEAHLARVYQKLGVTSRHELHEVLDRESPNQ